MNKSIKPPADSSSLIEVALFPIPNVVAFPGTNLPLHVFEPRYRQLVNDCVNENRMVGVSHVIKTIHQPKQSQTPEEALRSNQATYKPRTVFSAGYCEIIETLPDGRIIANVLMSQRLTLIEELQSLPYRIVSCTPMEDDDDPAAAVDNGDLQHSINTRLIELVGTQNPEMVRELQDPVWTELAPSEYSFKIFQLLRFDADIMQGILEAQSTNARLAMTWELLRAG